MNALYSFNLQKQSIEMPGTAQEGYSAIYRNSAVPYLSTNETYYDIFNRGRELSHNKPCLGWRPYDVEKAVYLPKYEWITYDEVEERRTAVASGLAHLAASGKLGQGLPKTHWTVSIWCQNRPEWQIIDFANVAHTRQTVGLYDTYDDESALYVLDHSETKVVFTTTSHISTLLSNREKLPHLRAIVLLDLIPGGALPTGELTRQQLARQWAATKDLLVYSFDEILALGRTNPVAHSPPQNNEEIASYCYTSGTTGKPKAALVAHYQLAYASATTPLGGFATDDSEVMLSYLPLAHIFGRFLEAVMFRLGASVGYFGGDVAKLIEDAQVLQPTLFPGVPRVFNRIASQIQIQVDGPGLKGSLLRTAVNAKLHYHDQDGSVNHAFWDRVVFKKVKALLGGRVRSMVSGSAPIRPDVIRLLRVCFGVDFREGYGQTENTGCCLIMFPNDKSLGSCGPPQPGLEIRLKDCPELGYRATDKPWPRGELLQRGQTRFPGYYKDAEKTKETIDEDGWLRSGDVAALDEYGRFRIIDRVKNLVKLAQGEYVAIENVEQVLSSNKYTAQTWLYGDSLQAHLVAISVIDPETFAPLASSITGKTVGATDATALAEAAKDPKVVKTVLDEYTKIGRQSRLAGFELIKALKLRIEPYSVENGLLTPTFKMKRPEAKKALQADLDALYAQEPANISSKL
jgi:long-chain acyl-CoA synthetase